MVEASEAERSFCARLFDWHRTHALNTSASLTAEGSSSVLTVRAPFLCAPDENGTLWLTGLVDPDDLNVLMQQPVHSESSPRLMLLTFAAAFDLPCSDLKVFQAVRRVYVAGVREELAGVRAYLAGLEEDRLAEVLPAPTPYRPKPPRL